MTGTSLSQIIVIGISPILTRIYSPEEFGIFALYLSIISILSIIITGRYELAVMLPKKDEDSYSLVSLSMCITLITSVILFVIVLLFNKQINQLLGMDDTSNLLYFIPLTMFIVGVYQPLNYWLNRKKEYKAISKNRVLQSTTTATANVAMGLSGMGVSGLVIGNILGQSFGLLRFLMITRKDRKNHKTTISNMKEQAIKYNNFPKFLIIAHGLESVSSNLPNILFTTFFNSTVVGYYSIVKRTISIPLTVVAKAIGDIFLQKASTEYAKSGSCDLIYLKTFKILFSIAVIPFIVFYFISGNLFAFVFGENWRVAGEYAQILTIPFFLQFITSPLTHIFIIAQKQRMELVLQLFLVILTVLVLFTGYYVFDSINISLILLSILYSVKYITFLLMGYSFSLGLQSKKE